MSFLKTLAGAGIGWLAGPIGAAIGASIGGSMDANDASAASTAKQMAYQTQMSNTSYQRGMADMRAAGLNPMLAYSQGGASVPSGASYTAQNVAAGAPAAVAQGLTLNAQLQNTAANTVLQKAQTAKTAAEAQISQVQAEQYKQHPLLMSLGLGDVTNSAATVGRGVVGAARAAGSAYKASQTGGIVDVMRRLLFNNK